MARSSVRSLRALASGMLAARLLLPGAAAAAPLTYRLGAGSRVEFTAHTSVHDVVGATDAVRGRVRFDPAAPLDARGKVSIDATRLETGNGARDRDLRGDVLAAERHPRIRLAMKRFVVPEGTRPELPMQGNIHGRLELRGAALPLLIPATVTAGPGGALRVDGRVAFDMTAWGVPPPRKGPIKTDPRVEVGFQLALEPEPFQGGVDAPDPE